MGLGVCENCDGVGEWVTQCITGYDPRDGSPLGWEEQHVCPQCQGSGRVVVDDDTLITLDDMEEAFGHGVDA